MIAAIALQVVLEPATDGEASVTLAGVLPNASGDWVAQDEPVGNTEQLVEKTNQLLQFDEFVFRTYRRGPVEFAVFITRWNPGKVSVHQVESHTPDACWPVNGWRCEDSVDRRILTLAGTNLPPARWRIFSHPMNRQMQVVFWHRTGPLWVEGDPNTTKSWIERSLTEIRARKDPQYFVRVTSSVPLDELATDSFFREVMQSIHAKILTVPVP